MHILGTILIIIFAIFWREILGISKE